MPQITAEQILREAKELQEQDFKPPRQKISDEAELAEYRLRKRKEFEDLVRRVRWNASVWVKVRMRSQLLCCHDAVAARPPACSQATARCMCRRRLTCEAAETAPLHASSFAPAARCRCLDESRCLMPACLQVTAHAPAASAAVKLNSSHEYRTGQRLCSCSRLHLAGMGRGHGMQRCKATLQGAGDHQGLVVGSVG